MLPAPEDRRTLHPAQKVHILFSLGSLGSLHTFFVVVFISEEFTWQRERRV